MQHQAEPTQADLSTSQPAEDDFFVFPASFAQQRLWFLNELEPDSAFYNIPAAVRLEGRLNAAALEKALAEIIQRHETLRTTFTSEDGQPLQVVAPKMAFKLDVVDLHHLPAPDREAAVLQQAEEEARKPFNLARGPLLRARLLVLGETDHVILLTLHHIISDGWSMGVLIREIAILYAAFSRNMPSPLPDLPIQYADYTLWQRDRLEGDGLAQQLAYWKSQLGDEIPVLNLPADRTRPAVQTFRGATCALKLPQELTVALQALSRAEGGTLFMTLLTAFQVLLYRYSGQEDFAIGSPIANRNQAEVEGLIGLFVNTLVFRSQINSEFSFRGLLKRVVAASFEAFANQDLPFDTLVEELNPSRDMSYNPLFQVMFILQNAASKVYELPEMKIQMLDVGTGTSTFDLTLSMAEQVDGLVADIEYNTDLFDEPTIQRMLEHFRALLEGIAHNPDESITRLAMLSAAERQQILVDWNDTDLTDPRLEWTLLRLFDHAAQRFGDLTALVFPSVESEVSGAASSEASFTYARLHQLVNQFAQLLVSHHVEPNRPVALLFDRSPEMIVALLAVVKTRAAYLPIDPLTPSDRLAFILEDAGVNLLVTQPHLVPGLPATNVETLALDPEFACLAGLPEAAPANPLSTPDDLAYLIYTSGSTGQPKGVRVRQRNLVNQFVAWERDYELAPGLRHLQMASYAFDVFSADLVRALASGGCLVVCPRDFLLDPPRLYGLLTGQHIGLAEFVPAVLRQLLTYLLQTGQDLAFLQRLICGSDVWYMGEYRQLLTLCGPNTHLINSFGLTEATIDSCYFDLPDLPLSDDAVVPIGIPFANNRLYILDRHLQPVPPLVNGELYVGGAAVAEGYHRRPELTAERFLPDPFSADPNARLYKTGDLSRYRPLPDGSAVVEFLGRLDFQVKIRGFRVETGEIEAALRLYPNVAQTVVMAASPNRAGAGARTDQVLVAYVVMDPPGEQPVELLREFLKSRLPDYMVPSIFIFLDHMPLSHNGKLDRKALPAPNWSRESFGQPYIAPRTPTEQAVAELWAQVLQLEQVGVEDNFFDMGGHSLLATQLVSRVRSTFGVDLPLRRVFESPTVAGIARIIDAAGKGASTEAAREEPPAIQPVPRDRPIPLSFAQQRLWFLDQLEPGSPFYNIPDAIRLTGKIDLAILERALNEVIRRHETLRTTFSDQGDQPVQVIAPSLHITLPITDLSDLPREAQEEAIDRLAQEEARLPFRLDQLPLLRTRLLRLGDEEHIILLTMHHIIGDDWSTNVLIEEISILYTAFAAGQPSPLPDLTIQYADYAAWQRGYLQGAELQRHLDYWKGQLADLPPLLEMPTDHPRPAVQSYRGAYQSFAFSLETTRRLHALANQEGASLFMVLLAAFQTLLMRYSGQEDICVGTPIANRNREDVENLIGFFVNTLALRTDLSGEELNFRKLLARVREVCLGAYAHQEIPFERLVDIVQPDRNLSHNPLFQVMFVLQNVPRRGKALPGLGVQPVEAHSGTSKFDLTLFLLEEGDRLAGAMEYSTDLFEPETIERMLQHFTILVEGILQDLDCPIGRLPLIGEAERRHLIDGLNQTVTPFPAERLVHQLFEDQVRRSPQAVAVTYQDQTLTYAELDRRANQLAHYLQQHGAGPDVVIGVCMQRSLELMVGLLGILKSGAAYLPLDPTYPADRLAFMVEDSRVPLLLTQERLAATGVISQLPAGACPVICLDRDWPAIDQQPGTAPDCHTTPEHLAYIIYTSGSTGRPKGAMIRHVGLTNYLTWCLQAYPLDRGIGTPVHSSISFDLTVTSLYPALLSGKTVFMLPDDLGVEALGTFLEDHEDLSLIKITPAHLKLLGEQVPAERAARLTHAFIIGGENLLVDHVDFWQKNAPETALVNEYGPTETVVGCCVYWAPPGKYQTGVIPIGKPIINTRLYVLDRYLQPVPTGVRGELYIGGTGVGRGYHNRPELTAERFLPDPLDPQPGARMYKSGDLVRWLPDGELECLGRIDFQVKIRGFRVELGEVESVLSQHPAVKEVVVWVREDQPANGDGKGAVIRRLVAYIVPQSDQEAPIPADLRAFVKERLPEYMVPSAFILLEALPLTSNGKLDRKALPAPEPIQAGLGSGYQAPGTPAEQALVEIWQSVLGLPQVGTGDNFFELGGDSILSLQIVTRARQRGLTLSPRMIFEHPTIAELAAETGTSVYPRAEQGPVTGEAPLTPIQAWFFRQGFEAPHHWNQSVALPVPQKIDPRHLESAVQALLEHHDALRARFVQDNETNWKTVYPPLEGAGSPVDWLDLSDLPGPERETRLAQAMEALQAGLDAQNGPVFRAGAWWTGTETRMLFAAHHLIIDAVSWRILLEDLFTAYQQIEAGQPVRLPEKTTSYRYWAEWLQQQAGSPDVLADLPYWLEQVEAPAAALPLDRMHGDNREQDAQTVQVSLTLEETQQLLQETAQTYRSDVPTAILAAMSLALQDWSGKSQWRFELESHGRDTADEGIDVSRTVGWFTALYPVRLDVTGVASPAAALQRVKETLARVPRNRHGYGLLASGHPDASIRSRLSPSGATQITLNYFGKMDGPTTSDAPELPASTASRGTERSLRNARTSLWEITGGINNGQLQLEWTYSRELHHRETVEAVAESFVSHLKSIFSGEPAPMITDLSDFSDFGWDQSDLDDILKAIQPSDEADEAQD